MASAKVPVYSVSELKNTTDDAIVAYLTTTLPTQSRFIANNTKSNVRLALGYSAVAIAGVSFYVDYMKGWEATRTWMLSAVISYFALNCALTVWIWAVEATQIFDGATKRGEKLRISSSTQKYSPIYTLQFQHTSPSGQLVEDKSITAPFSRWFSADGIFHLEPFKLWLESEIKLLSSQSQSSDSKGK